ncbi:MAG TPA: hypothetical protein VFE47_16115 [Tepidisphaeraceae bacterium]|jgi:hypothetical protein|nr:hypothetical protein [Tepidisphaeraceae bacterium]
MTVKLYRAVCRAEADLAVSLGTLSVIEGSLEGKWFAERIDDARRWGEYFSRISGAENNIILEVEYPDTLVELFFRAPRLDGIGPAIFAHAPEFAQCVAIREVGP